MSILSTIFGGQSAASQATQDNQGTQDTQGTGTQDNPPANEPTGLDKFNDIINFKPDPESQPKPFNPDELITVDPKALQEEVSKMNFLEGTMTKEDATAIVEGGEGALAAMAKVMNSAMQKVFMQNTLASRAIASKTLGNSLDHVDSRIAGMMRKDKINSTLAQANPALSHPAAAPMIEALIPKIEAKFPNASPEEIKDKATEYFLEFANQINPHKEDKKSTSQADEIDWFDWVKDQ